MSNFTDDAKCIESRKLVIQGGWNGGGSVVSSGAMGAGGGATDIRIGGVELVDRVLVAGGGGGGSFMGKGGDGGGAEGGNAELLDETDHAYSLGSGGTQTNHGIIFERSLSYDIETNPTFTGNHFSNSLGDLGIGGNGIGRHCGGASGGGGYYGGAGTYNAGGGGGGSSYASPMFFNVNHKQGGNAGHGYIYIHRLDIITNIHFHKISKCYISIFLCLILK